MWVSIVTASQPTKCDGTIGCTTQMTYNRKIAEYRNVWYLL